MSEISNQSVKQKAVSLIREYLGVFAAKSYEDFYTSQKDEMVMISLNELLSEFLGQQKTNEIMREYFKNTNLV